MKTRRQFLGLLAGLPFVGRLFEEKTEPSHVLSSWDRDLVNAQTFGSEITSTPGSKYSYYVYWNGEGYVKYTDLEGNPIDVTNTF